MVISVHLNRSMKIRRDAVPQSGSSPAYDVVLIGGGIMSATLGTMLKELEPDWSIALYENLHQAGQESSDPWNNAGTRSEEHTSELQSRFDLVCRLLLEK